MATYWVGRGVNWESTVLDQVPGVRRKTELWRIRNDLSADMKGLRPNAENNELGQDRVYLMREDKCMSDWELIQRLLTHYTEVSYREDVPLVTRSHAVQMSK